MFGMSSVNDTPSTDIFPEASQDSDSLQRRRILLNAVDTVMEKYVKFSMTEGEEEDDGGRDGVCEYAQEVLSLGLLYMEFNDAIREGDGERILRC